MPFYDRVKVATSTTGTGTITLGAAQAGYQTAADAGVLSGDKLSYVIEDGNDWERDTVGGYSSSGPTLTRPQSENFESSTGSLLNLSGNAMVYLSPGAADIDRIAQIALPVVASDELTPLTTGLKVTFRVPYALRLTEIRASLTTAQTSGSIFTVLVNQNGASILSTNLTIDNGETTSVSAAAPAVISTNRLAENAEITVTIDQIGDGTAAGLKLILLGYLALPQVFGPECVTNGDPFGAGWTLTGTDGSPPVIAGGVLTFATDGFDSAFAQRASAETLTAGDYRVETTIDSIVSGNVGPTVGGVNGVSRTAPGSYVETITTTAANQNVRLIDTSGASGAVYSRFSVRRIL